jgi:nucleotidyltransferase/DNA polymerase involved in DNA repair
VKVKEEKKTRTSNIHDILKIDEDLLMEMLEEHGHHHLDPSDGEDNELMEEEIKEENEYLDSLREKRKIDD